MKISSFLNEYNPSDNYRVDKKQEGADNDKFFKLLRKHMGIDVLVKDTRNNSYDTKIIPNEKYTGDFFPKDRPTTIEIKNERTFRETGRIGIEFERRGMGGRGDFEPSGISVSQAEYYMFAIWKKDESQLPDYCFIKTSELKSMIAAKQYSFIGKHRGEIDSNNYIFEGSVILPRMSRIKNTKDGFQVVKG
jgi:hypothetical protein